MVFEYWVVLLFLILFYSCLILTTGASIYTGTKAKVVLIPGSLLKHIWQTIHNSHFLLIWVESRHQ